MKCRSMRLFSQLSHMQLRAFRVGAVKKTQHKLSIEHREKITMLREGHVGHKNIHSSMYYMHSDLTLESGLSAEPAIYVEPNHS